MVRSKGAARPLGARPSPGRREECPDSTINCKNKLKSTFKEPFCVGELKLPKMGDYKMENYLIG